MEESVREASIPARNCSVTEEASMLDLASLRVPKKGSWNRDYRPDGNKA